MANNSDYNYYKSEYSKFKNNYYTPGNNNNNKGSGGKSIKRFVRSFIVFLITFGVIAAAVFGGVKLYKSIASKKESQTTAATTAVTEESKTQAEKTTAEKTTAEETTKKVETTKDASSSGKITAGTVAYVKTPDNTGIYLRHNPTYDEYGYAPLSDGTKVVVSEVSADGLWAKTSNFDIDGWVYTKYLVPSDSDSASTNGQSYSNSTTSASIGSDKLTFGEALTIFGNDTSRNLYMNCVINSSNVSGIADYQDPGSNVIATFSSGQAVPIYSVRSGYGKTRVNGVETWIPTQYLDFDSWGYYR